MGGNYDALVALLKRFEQSQGRAVDEVRTLLAGGDTVLASQALHRLRGVAANLGAREVARLAGAAETALQAGAGRPDAASDPALQNTLNALERALELVAGGARAVQTSSSTFTISNTIMHDLPQKLAELQGLLQNNNLKALEHFQELRPALATVEQAVALAEAVETLNFKVAQKMVEDILQRKESA
jgi:HPt (histidine-containing phosphotransfer) domain-containing protein